MTKDDIQGAQSTDPNANRPNDRLATSGRRWRAWAWDALAIFLLLSARFTHFLAVRDYGYFHLEIFPAIGVIGAIAGLIACLIAIRPESFRPLVFGILIFAIFLSDTGLPLPTVLFSQMEPELEKILRFSLLAVLVSTFLWMLRAHLNKIIVALFGVALIASIFLPNPAVEEFSIVERRQSATTNRGPVIHLILDQQIGINGLVETIPGAAQARQNLLDLYLAKGFRVYGAAFTHFSYTLESIPNLLNNSVEPQSDRWIRDSGGSVALIENAWFRHLKAKGYTIEVVQSAYLDYCLDPAVPVTRCETYNPNDIRFLHHLDFGAVAKARYLLYYFLDVDHELLSRGLRFSWDIIRVLSAWIGLTLPDWTERGVSPSPVVSLNAIDRLTDRLRSIGPGQALFAHLLLPHHPYALAESCAIKPRFDEWADRVGTTQWRYRQYFKQMRCLNRRLKQMFEVLEDSGGVEDATIIVHGDHGSLITTLYPINRDMAAISPLDVLSSYSTLLAVRAPGLPPGLDNEFASIQGLFARDVMGRVDISDHRDIFFRPDRIDEKPGRRPMETYGPIEKFR